MPNVTAVKTMLKKTNTCASAEQLHVWNKVCHVSILAFRSIHFAAQLLLKFHNVKASASFCGKGSVLEIESVHT